ncbi:hypothetical protein T12_8132 [Trichinella patagoniensis]|uniref:Uncharacterized protein n=1 Tax=Trichinella patagoniensis TaxID=990121 RepID=A0A0V0ZML1_9BILA|nr:hypothetical protein T12_8132 [Trichinella patagoniensis]
MKKWLSNSSIEEYCLLKAFLKLASQLYVHQAKKNQYCTRWVVPWLKPMMIFLLQQQHDVMSRVHTYAYYCLKGGLERGCFEDFSNILALLLTDWIDVVNLKSRLLGQLCFICNLAKAERSPSNYALRLSTLFVHCSFAIAIDMSYCRKNGQNETSHVLTEDSIGVSGEHNLLFDLSLTTATGTNIIMSWETTKGDRITVYNQQHMWDILYREIILL